MPNDLPPQDAAVAQYRPVSAAAISGLILSVASAAVLVHPVLWVLPALGVLLSAIGFYRVAVSGGALLGRRAAMIGLWLSVVWLTAGPTNWVGYRWALRREARQFAQYWFQFLTENRPREAHQLTQFPTRRAPLDVYLAERYAEGTRWGEQLKTFLSDRMVSTLLSQQAAAQVEYIDSPAVEHQERYDLVTLRYAVRYLDGARQQTAYVLLYLHRVYLDDGRGANWQIARWDFTH